MSEAAASAAPKKNVRDLPGPMNVPILGAAYALRPDNAHLVFEDWQRKYGDLFRFRLGSRWGVGVAVPEVAREVMQARPDSFRRPAVLERVSVELGMLGVFSAEGPPWRRQRRLINPSFHAAHIESFHDSIAMVIERVLNEWARTGDGAEGIDALADLMRFTVDVTSILAFGRDLDTVRRGTGEVQRHLERIITTVNQRVLSPVALWRVFPFLNREVDASRAEIRKLIVGLITDGRAALEASRARAEKPRTLLESMLVARDDEEAKEPLSDDEVYANVITVLLAGEDTTAITLAWMLYYLALRPDVAAGVRAEVDSVVTGVVPTIAEAKELKYVEAVALEALRLRSPAPQLYLEALHDVDVAGVAIPRGVGVLVMLRSIQMNPRVFGDPESFRPERWLPDAPEDTKPHSPRMMLAFGGGPRVCPGRGLALLECALLVGAVAKRFDVALACDANDVREVTAFTAQPRGMRLRLTERV